MDFVTAVKTCFRKYFVFWGRARRSEMWNFFLFIILANLILSFIDALIFNTPMPLYARGGQIGFNFGDGPLGSIFSYLTLVPWLTVGIRRMHDTGRTGWWWGGLYLAFSAWVLINLFMFPAFGRGSSEVVRTLFSIGSLTLLLWFVTNFIFTLLDTQKGHNKYGPDPKYGDIESTFD